MRPSAKLAALAALLLAVVCFCEYAKPASAGQAPAGPSCNVTVAVVDSGVNPVGDLAGKVLPGYNASDGSTDTVDTVGHGTAVASIVESACPGVMILPIKTDKPRTDSVMANAIALAVEHGGKVINASVDVLRKSAPQTVEAIARAEANNATVVLAAGNDARDSPRDIPMSLEVPAETIWVGGTSPDGTLNGLSNYGPWVTIAAPIRVAAYGANGVIGSYNGTSFSAPQVTGAAARLLTYNPGLTPAQVKALLMEHGTANPALNGLIACGCIVNASAALQAAETLYPYPPPAPPATVDPQPSPAPVKSKNITAPAKHQLHVRGLVKV